MFYQQLGMGFVGFADLTISEMVKHYFEFFEHRSILVTSLDSEQDLRGYGRWLHLKKPAWRTQIFGRSIWISEESTSEFLLGTNTLSHFDEMYLLSERPSHYVRLDQSFTSDRCDFSKDVPQSFVETLNILSASRYLSDGCGLNFACQKVEEVNRIGEIERQIIRGGPSAE